MMGMFSITVFLPCLLPFPSRRPGLLKQGNAVFEIRELCFNPFDQREHRILQALVPVAQLPVFSQQRPFPRRDKVGLAEERSSTVMSSETHLMRFSVLSSSDWRNPNIDKPVKRDFVLLCLF